MFKKILVAYDGSMHAQKALDAAIDLAQKYNSFIGVVSVINLPDFAGTVSEVDEIMAIPAIQLSNLPVKTNLILF
ncbi:universal stress protein [Desulfallas sp. Bu1-1]|uniref:universal stress protein n=1 Tax=Desulfallas sp. Bu1-1 TaxID=2787620 RepID=UPI001A9C002A